jgi:MEMO1 family protein
VSATLPRLRADLDFMPSPVEDRPGLLIRDSFRYSEAVLIIPQALLPCLQFFDGEHTESDLRDALFRMTGELDLGPIIDHLKQTLSESGFFEDERFDQMKHTRQAEFAAMPVREPAHAGSAYPEEIAELRGVMSGWMDGAGVGSPNLKRRDLTGIAAPHVSPGGGYECYRAAYNLMGTEYTDRTFVVLGTSHYGAPNRFGITRKPYATPFGETMPASDLIEELIRKAPEAITVEDYCHAVEHSVEFQVLFLQSIFGPDIRVLPILCGSFGESIYRGGAPEDYGAVNRFLGALGEIGARERNRLFWVLGIDMAHMGRRYGDEFTAIANEDGMQSVAARDRQRMERAVAGDAAGFWELVKENRDDLKWCGSSPMYTFLRALPEARGSIEKYEQWNIDEQSVVSFAGLSFSR